MSGKAPLTSRDVMMRLIGSMSTTASCTNMASSGNLPGMAPQIMDGTARYTARANRLRMSIQMSLASAVAHTRGLQLSGFAQLPFLYRLAQSGGTSVFMIAPLLGAAQPWGRGHLHYARLEGDPGHPSEQAEQEATQDLSFWIPRLVTGEQLELAVRIRWVLSSWSRHLAEGTRTMTDVTFGHRTGHTPPATMDRPDQWRYVATRLMAHMGAYSPDEMNRLHWRCHQCAALRIRAAMQDHNIWNIPGSPGHQGHASGQRQPRSQDIPGPPRQAARRNSPEHPRGRPPGRGSPSGIFSSPLRPFAPRRSPGSPHASRVQGDTMWPPGSWLIWEPTAQMK